MPQLSSRQPCAITAKPPKIPLPWPYAGSSNCRQPEIRGLQSYKSSKTRIDLLTSFIWSIVNAPIFLLRR